MEKLEKLKIFKQYILMNVDKIIFLIYLVLLREYYLLSQNTESSIEQ